MMLVFPSALIRTNNFASRVIENYLGYFLSLNNVLSAIDIYLKVIFGLVSLFKASDRILVFNTLTKQAFALFEVNGFDLFLK